MFQNCPTICAIVPKGDRCVVPRPVPNPACETAIVRGEGRGIPGEGEVLLARVEV